MKSYVRKNKVKTLSSRVLNWFTFTCRFFLHVLHIFQLVIFPNNLYIYAAAQEEYNDVKTMFA